MAYTPVGWQTGDTITAERLNRMDRGWDVAKTELFSETVTTVAGQRGNIAELTYSTLIDAPTITVTFDGTDYVCDVIDFMFKYYGGFTPMGLDTTEYPFFIESTGQTNTIITQTEGTHTIAVTAPSMQTSADFAEAVKDVTSTLPIPFKVATGITTWQQLTDAMLSEGRVAHFVNDDGVGGAQAYFFVDTYIVTDDAYYATAISVSHRTTSFTTMRFKAASSDSVLELA